MDIYNLEVVILDLYMLFAPLPCRTAHYVWQGLASSLREHHLNYFYHIFDLFKPFINKGYNLKSRSFVDNRTNIKYSSISFNSLTLPCFNYYRDLFYEPILLTKGERAPYMTYGSLRVKGRRKILR